jgi:DNA-binding protein HU-beta
MNKRELISAVTRDVDITIEQSTRVVSAVFDNISKALIRGDKALIVGFGTFDTKERTAREGRNPKTGEAVQIAASRSVSFKVGKELKEAVKK